MGVSLAFSFRLRAKHLVTLHVRFLEHQTEAGLQKVGTQHSVRYLDGALESHFFDPLVIVKIFDVDGSLSRAAGVCVDRW